MPNWLMLSLIYTKSITVMAIMLKDVCVAKADSYANLYICAFMTQ